MLPERFISADKLKAGSPDIDMNIANQEAFVNAGKEMFGEFGCISMIAYDKTKTLSAFKMLSRVREIDPQIANEISKQIQIFEKDAKHLAEEYQDDPDFNIDEYIDINDYIEEKYIPIIDDSKKYQNIIIRQHEHPCGFITYHKDLRELIGLIRLNSKTGKKEIHYCAFIDGVTADHIGYVKSDLNIRG